MNTAVNLTPFSRHFSFSDDITWIARVCATQLPDHKAAHVGMKAMETKGDEFCRLDIIMLYESEDPTMEELPDAVYVRNDKGAMVKVVGVHRGSGWRAVQRDGHVIEAGDTLTDHHGGRHIARDVTPPQRPGSTGRVWTDKGGFFPSLFNARIVNFTR